MNVSKRRSLRPLSAHIGMAVSAYSAVPDGVKFPGKIEEMLRGIQAYYQHPYEAEILPLETHWQEGTVRVQSTHNANHKKDAPVILLIPSLINSAKILDLTAERSLLRWLQSNSVNAFLLDWGKVTQGEGQDTIEQLIENRLLPAIHFLANHTRQDIHVMGYCMGGTILAAAASLNSAHIKSLIFLAAPWDFHAGSKALKNRVDFWAPTMLPVISEKNILAVDWTQMLFASLDPISTSEKFAKFASMDPGSKQAQLFVAVEDWLNDGVDLPGAVGEECIRGWFHENAPMQGKWMLAGKKVDVASVECPALVIASTKDRLVEYESAAALQTKNTKIINPECGHIGMIAGDKAVEKVWKPLLEWVHDKHEGS